MSVALLSLLDLGFVFVFCLFSLSVTLLSLLTLFSFVCFSVFVYMDDREIVLVAPKAVDLSGTAVFRFKICVALQPFPPPLLSLPPTHFPLFVYLPCVRLKYFSFYQLIISFLGV